MNKFLVLTLTVVGFSLLTACAAKGPSEGMKLQCPACGHNYEYIAPTVQ